MTEQELIACLLKGDESAFKTVIDTYKKMVFNTVLGFVQNIEDAEDVTQDVFIKKRKKRMGFLTSLFGDKNELLHDPPDFIHPGVLAENREQSVILFNAVNQLPENQKTAFMLQKIQDMSQQQIAEIMELSEGAVESLLSRAKANLKKLLINYYSSL